MEFGIIFLMVIVVASVDFFIYLKIKENFKNGATLLEENYTRLKERYEVLKGEVEMLKKELKEKEAEYVKLKNKKEVEERKSEQTVPGEVEILLSEKLVSVSDIEKAKDFIRNNNLSFSISDALVLLGKLEPNEAQMVKAKLRKDE